MILRPPVPPVLAGAFALALLAGTCLAHGGQYVPPTTAPATPPPSGPPVPPPPPAAPSIPGRPTPTLPTPANPGPPGAGPAAPGGSPALTPGGSLEEDVTRWTYWWEYNKYAFLQRGEQAVASLPETGSDDFFLGATRGRDTRRAVRTPNERDIDAVLLPALKRAIDANDNRDITTAVMVAMAKTGCDQTAFALFDVFAPRLARGNQEIRETAALALGLAGIDGERERALLFALVGDEAAGRAACGREHVDERTRAFAAYGLGLFARRSEALGTRFAVAKALEAVLADPATGRDLAVAAISGLSLLGPRGDRPGERALAGSVAGTLEAWFLARRGPADQVVQSHCATAIARLIAPDDAHADHLRQVFAAQLGDRRSDRSGPDLARGAALALGRLCRADAVDRDARSTDRDGADALLAAYREHKDQQTRYFAIVALGLIGGERNRDALLREFDRASKTQEKPWCALAVGLCERGRRAALSDPQRTAKPDPLVADALRDALRQSHNADLTGALAIGLGLAGITAAGDDLRELLHKSLGQEELAGQLCLALALMRHHGIADELRDLLRLAVRRPELMRQAALALAHLGDARAAEDLRTMLAKDEPDLARLASIAQALGLVGDRSSIAPLVELLDDDALPKLSRAFVAVALGGIADEAPRPWSSEFSIGVNYRAIVPSLIDASCGILDIL